MKHSNLRSCVPHALAAFLLAGGLAASAQSLTLYKAQSSGSSVKIDGSSTIHNWTVEGKIIGGQFEVDPAFPLGGTPPAGKVNAKAKATIPVRSLKSGKATMDDVMQEHMKAKEFPKIDYELVGMNLKDSPKSASDPLMFDAQGKLTISGVTRTNAMLVTCDRADVSKLKFKSVANLKMTDYGISPPAPNIALGLIKTGDDIKVTIEWVTVLPKPDGDK
ncbi:MAG: YceI family protein [Verrucomicrobia bacterium]|nr:YceI family protein [Verrucomicrobiota bacterium]MBI3870970.1 YceI family protein [Verrucomicrobiota bacterium]